MSKMKELFMQFQTEMGRNDEFIDDEYQFQQWLDEKEAQYDIENEVSGSIFPDELFYDDEYYKSTYHPTIEEEQAAFELFKNE